MRVWNQDPQLLSSKSSFRGMSKKPVQRSSSIQGKTYLIKFQDAGSKAEWMTHVNKIRMESTRIPDKSAQPESTLV